MKCQRKMTHLTTDTFFDGRIRVSQHRSGYRFSVDAILLSHYVRPRSNDVILDLGTGCGIIPVILGHYYPDITIYGVELQEELAALAVRNVDDNGMAGRIAIFHQDLLALGRDRIPEPVHTIVCNPPYRKAQSGRLNRDSQRAIARHELNLTLQDVIEAARRLLDISGRFVTIYAAQRATELLSKMHLSGIEPKRLRMVHSYRHSEAPLMLVEGIRGGRSGITIDPPLVLYRDDGCYTDEVEKMFRGGAA